MAPRSDSPGMKTSSPDAVGLDTNPKPRAFTLIVPSRSSRSRPPRSRRPPPSRSRLSFQPGMGLSASWARPPLVSWACSPFLAALVSWACSPFLGLWVSWACSPFFALSASASSPRVLFGARQPPPVPRLTIRNLCPSRACRTPSKTRLSRRRKKPWYFASLTPSDLAISRACTALSSPPRSLRTSARVGKALDMPREYLTRRSG